MSDPSEKLGEGLQRTGQAVQNVGGEILKAALALGFIILIVGGIIGTCLASADSNGSDCELRWEQGPHGQTLVCK